MSLIVSLEQKIGRLAIPNVISILACFQILTWVLLQFKPEMAVMLVFSPDAILEGEVWRLFSYLALPGGIGFLWLLFVTVMFFFNNGLQQAWGSFRLNLFIFLGVVCVDLGGFLFDYTSTGVILWTSVLMAFAVYYPNEELQLYGIIPIKVSWLAWAAAAWLAFEAVGKPLKRAEIFFSVLNFILTFGPGFIQQLRHRSVVTQRRQRYDEAKLPEEESWNKCSKCGRSEKTDPQLDFRVTASGEDICNECRAAAAASK